MLKPDSNKELLLRLKDSDVSGFNALFWKYHRPLYANAYKLVRNSELAEDIVQETFITLWEKRSTLDPDRDISGWLFVICYNKSVDQLKLQLKESLEQQRLHRSIEIATDINLNLFDLRMSTLEKAMDELSPQKRRVFELC
ncbi:MAG: sigma-70 family RNA polymerase sigma factor, partial [Chitinophagales bacterium]